MTRTWRLDHGGGHCYLYAVEGNDSNASMRKPDGSVRLNVLRSRDERTTGDTSFQAT